MKVNGKIIKGMGEVPTHFLTLEWSIVGLGKMELGMDMENSFKPTASF